MTTGADGGGAGNSPATIYRVPGRSADAGSEEITLYK